MGNAQLHDGKLLFNKLLPRVREILMRDWDPIGISHMPGAPRDEYDQYATWLCGGLFDPDLSEARIANYLAQVADKRMGLAPNEPAIERAARAIAALRQEFFGTT